MQLYDPALMAAFYYTAGDRGGEQLWQAVQAVPVGKRSNVRRQRWSIDGATVLQVALERSGACDARAWQELTQEMERWLGSAWNNPPGHPWGATRVYLGAAVAGVYEEQTLLQEGLALPPGQARPVVPLTVGRLWLITAPGMSERGNVIATYAWVHPPAEEARRRIEGLTRGEGASFLRAELYLHRALHPLRQYGREERAAFWATLDQLEGAAVASLAAHGGEASMETLRAALRQALAGTAQLGRRYNLLRSSAYLYGQIGADLSQEGGRLFAWYDERLKEALVQWGYDLERAGGSITQARTAFAAWQEKEEPVQPPGAELPVAPATAPDLVGENPPWFLYLMALAIVALTLVDDSWAIVAVRAGVLLLFVLAAVGWQWWTKRRARRQAAEAVGLSGEPD